MFWIRATENSINPAGFFKILDFHRFLEVFGMPSPVAGRMFYLRYVWDGFGLLTGQEMFVVVFFGCINNSKRVISD